MKVSVFTPSHNVIYLADCYRSLAAQTLDDWEWVVVLNGTAQAWAPPVTDSRVRVERIKRCRGVGEAKRAACELARGELLVELDHDDILSSDCLAEVVAAFEAHPDAGSVYSNFAQINPDGTRNEELFDLGAGWSYDDVEVDGRPVLQCRAMAPTPHNLGYIWFAPNHVRAFRRSTYEDVGGYDPELTVLDDQDLMCRMYQAAEFIHVDRCLYLQRLHKKNTQRVASINATIQAQTVALYDRYIDGLARAWAGRKGLRALNLGALHSPAPGYLGVDVGPGEGVDLVVDVARGIDLPDSSVGVVRAVDVLNHVGDKVALFNELYRLLDHGGMLLSLTPSTDGRGAFQDPTAAAYYNQNSFWYFTEPDFARFVPGLEARFQSSRLVTYFPTPWHQENGISYVSANLIAIKEGARQGGQMRW